MSVQVGIAGVSGYTGVELLRLLSAHPHARVAAVAADRSAGQRLSRVWPGLTGLVDDLEVERLDADGVFRGCEVVFLALPHGVAAKVAPRLVDQGVLVIDLGADFRLKDPAAYEAAYGLPHPCPERLGQAVYGLPELNREALKGARLVANPGCYPTATAIAALPLVRSGMVSWLVADCLSGVSGAGRQPGPRNIYCEVAEGASPYGLAGTHRHTPEIEQTLGVPVTFTPHLVPMVRGMVATVHARLGAPVTTAELLASYADTYADHPMVVLRETPPCTADVRGTNRAHVTVVVDQARAVVTAVAVIDNLVKGASGQAVQCMNLALGLPETTGLPLFPLLP